MGTDRFLGLTKAQFVFISSLFSVIWHDRGKGGNWPGVIPPLCQRAPQEHQGKEDRVPGKRGVTASVNSTAIFGLGTLIAGGGGGRECRLLSLRGRAAS